MCNRCFDLRVFEIACRQPHGISLQASGFASEKFLYRRCDIWSKRTNMKIAFIVHNEYMSDQVMQLLKSAGIDYYTRWDQAQGKGHGTEPHLGSGSHATTNAVLMIAFPDEAPLEKLIGSITAANAGIQRSDDKIRLFQLPLDRIV
jgi:hypothetical protein